MLKQGKKICNPGNNHLKAVIPSAGLGMRFKPYSLAVPKELLPVSRKPLIRWAVEEALAAGIRDIGIVIRKGKEMIKDYLEALMRSPNSLPGLSTDTLSFIFQQRPLGLGNALYEAGRFLSDSPFIMIIPDQLVASKVPASTQLLQAASGDTGAVWSSLVRISKEELHLFPGSRRFTLTNPRGNVWEVTGFQEKPELQDQENLLGFGRTFFPAGVGEFFSEGFLNPTTKEVDLFLSFKALLKERKNYAVLLEGRAMDFGTWEGYECFSQWLTNHAIGERNHG